MRRPTGISTRGYASLLTPQEWFTLEILMEDNRETVLLNGKRVESITDVQRLFTSGAIGLYLEKAGTVLEFRKIEIRNCRRPATSPSPPPSRSN